MLLANARGATASHVAGGGFIKIGLSAIGNVEVRQDEIGHIELAGLRIGERHLHGSPIAQSPDELVRGDDVCLAEDC